MPLLLACNKNQDFSRRGPREGKSYCFKHIAEWGRGIIGQYMEIWLFNPLCSNGLSHTDKIKIVHCISIKQGFTCHIFKTLMFYIPKDYFYLNKQCRS